MLVEPAPGRLRESPRSTPRRIRGRTLRRPQLTLPYITIDQRQRVHARDDLDGPASARHYRRRVTDKVCRREFTLSPRLIEHITRVRHRFHEQYYYASPISPR